MAFGVTNIGIKDSDDTTVSYVIKEFLIRRNTVKYFTDFQVPENEEDEYELLMSGHFYSDILSAEGFDREAYNNLLEATEKQIEFEITKIHNQFKHETGAHLEQIRLECEQLVETFSPLIAVFGKISPEKMSEVLGDVVKLEGAVREAIEKIPRKETDDMVS